MLDNKISRVVVASGVAALAIAGTLLTASPASAAPPGSEIDYNTTGSTTLTNPNSNVTVQFAPAVLRSFVNFDAQGAAVKALLPLAPAKASFLAYGFLPAKGTVVFTQVGYASGRLTNATPDGVFPLSVTATYVVTLRDVTIGNTKVDVGTNCQTLKPVVATVSSDDFNLSQGTLNGTYNLSNFNNCGKALQIINSTLPGTGNTLSLAIQFGDPSADLKAVASKLNSR